MSDLLTIDDIRADRVGKPTTVFTADEILTDIPEPTELPRVPEEHQASFIQKLGSQIYDWGLNTALKAAGGIVEGVAETNNFMEFALAPFIMKRDEYGFVGFPDLDTQRKMYQETFVEPLRQKALAANAAVPEEKLGERVYYETVGGMARMGVTIPTDVMLGGMVKSALSGQILPAVEAILSRVPDFALGMGWKGLVEGLQQGDSGIMEAGENIALGTLYGAAGTGFAGIGKMSGISVAQYVYESMKQGETPTKDGMVNAAASGAAMGMVFTMMPALVEGTKVIAERNALGRYEKRLSKTPEKASEILDAMLQDKAIRPEVRQALTEPFLQLLEKRGEVVPSELSLGSWKDTGRLNQRMNTMVRNIEKIAPGQDAKVVKDFLMDKVTENETYKARWERDLRTLSENKTKEWGIKAGSKEDAATMRFGEGRMTLEELKQSHPDMWQKIKAASEWYRGQYDELLDTINNVREQNGFEPIKKREDYFRHFLDLDRGSRVFGFINVKETPTDIAGLGREVKPGKPFTSVEMKRKGEVTVESAIRGFNNYIDSAANQIFHTDSVKRARVLENYIRKQALTNDTIDLDNFVTNLKDQGDILAGVPLKLDKAVQDISPTTFAALRWLERRTSANMVGLNIASALNNFIPFTQSLSTTQKIPALRGLWTATTTPLNAHSFAVDGVESSLYLRRFPKKDIGGIEATARGGYFENNQAKIYALQRFIDQFAVRAIVSGKYYEAKGKGSAPQEAMKIADDYASRVVQDRSWGQLPTLMEAKSLRFVSQFQIEVLNLANWLQHDVPQMAQGDAIKLASMFAQFSVYSFVTNNVAEKIFGRRPTMDPVYFLGSMMGLTEQGRNRKFWERVMPSVKEFGQQLPFASMAFEGGRFPIAAGVPRLEKVFGGDIQEAAAELTRPVLYYAFPAGGGQVRKTVTGMRGYYKGYSETGGGDVRYYVDKDLSNFMRAFLFGKNAFPEAVEYWRKPESER